MSRLSQVLLLLVAFPAVVPLILTTRTHGGCHEGCFTKGNFTRYNDWELDYATSISVCIDYARETHEDQGGQCVTVKDCTRWRVLDAHRYCGAVDKRGENYPNTGRLTNPLAYMEPTRCSMQSR